MLGLAKEASEQLQWGEMDQTTLPSTYPQDSKMQTAQTDCQSQEGQLCALDNLDLTVVLQDLIQRPEHCMSMNSSILAFLQKQEACSRPL